MGTIKQEKKHAVYTQYEKVAKSHKLTHTLDRRGQPKLLTICVCQTLKKQLGSKLLSIPAIITLFKDATAMTLPMHWMLSST